MSVGKEFRWPENADRYWNIGRLRYLVLGLRVVGFFTLLAFAAAMMPSNWFVAISNWLGQDFPETPIGYYLARNLSAMYGFVGAGLWVLAADVHRFGPLVPWVGRAAIAFGLLQLIMDHWAGLPWWWTLAEGLSTVVGGIVLLALTAWCRSTPDSMKSETPS